MGIEVRKDGMPWGTADITKQGDRVQFYITGPLYTDAVYRVWGRSKEREPILLGVAEPNGQKLVLDRTRTRHELSLFGYCDVPEEYILSVHEPEWNCFTDTGEELLDAAIQKYHLPVKQDGEIYRITCPFEKNVEFPLAFACCLCSVSQNTAFLNWHRISDTAK